MCMLSRNTTRNWFYKGSFCPDARIRNISLQSTKQSEDNKRVLLRVGVLLIYKENTDR